MPPVLRYLLFFPIALAGAADASATPSGGSILYADGGSLWRTAADGSGEPVEVVRMGPDAAPIARLDASRDGRVVLIRAGDALWWAAVGDRAPATPRPLNCSGEAHLSADGRAVACVGAARALVLYRLEPLRKTARTLPARLAGFSGAGRDAVVLTDDDGVWEVPLRDPARRRLLSPHPPGSAFLPSPDGRRAVALYDDGGRDDDDDEGDDDDDDDDRASAPTAAARPHTIYGFRLDGKAARRKLMRGEPVRWSQNSQWLLVQGRRRACLVRGVGGQYKCWDRYRAVSLSPSGEFALLARPSGDGAGLDLYHARLAGARPEAPRRIRAGVTGPAIWLP
jgi:hypothetical protein